MPSCPFAKVVFDPGQPDNRTAATHSSHDSYESAPAHRPMKFLDEAKIFLKSGDGGHGSVAFRREKYVPRGGPAGGDGGRGGHVIFKAVPALNTLIDFRYRQHFKAERGENGMGSNRSGKQGEDLIVPVPIGTQILDEDRETLLADLSEEGDSVQLLRGGDGGYGNSHYKTSTNQAPRYAQKGFEGEECWVWLRLKLIADAGLVGLPNAGKSTFLAANSAAKPKIADYPFTTIAPNLGVVETQDGSFVLADIPGLIEGASEGKGLGDRFLGHVERTRILLHLIDGTAEDVVENYRIVRGELTAYGNGLADKPEIVALNKIDALSEEEIAEKVAALRAETDATVYELSGATSQGLKPIIYALEAAILKANAIPEEEDDAPWEQEAAVTDTAQDSEY